MQLEWNQSIEELLFVCRTERNLLKSSFTTNTTISIPLLTHFPFLSNNIPSWSSLDTTNQSMVTRSLVPKQWDPSLECKIYYEDMTHYLLDLTLFLISRGIHRAFATEVACRQGALTSTLPPSHLGLAYALLVETSHFPDFVVISRNLNCEYPQYFNVTA